MLICEFKCFFLTHILLGILHRIEVQTIFRDKDLGKTLENQRRIAFRSHIGFNLKQLYFYFYGTLFMCLSVPKIVAFDRTRSQDEKVKRIYFFILFSLKEHRAG